MAKNHRGFAALKILVLEDDYLIARDITQTLQNEGVFVVGPFSSFEEARMVLDQQEVDAAILDVRLAENLSFTPAEILLDRRLPFVFVSGVGEEAFPDHLRTVPRIEKPFSTDQILDWLRTTFSTPLGNSLAHDEPLSNLLLNSLDDEEITGLKPHMLRVRFKRRSILQRHNRPMERVYFPEKGIVSMLVGVGDQIAEVGIIGREGAIGLPISDSVHPMPIQFIVQADGEAVAINARVFHDLMCRSLRLSSLLLRFQHVLTLQIAHTALAHAAFSVEQRLARWLLMYQDRVGQEVLIVHEFLSLMLHVRRPSVTLAIQSLESTGAISTERGQIIIRDREKLLAMAAASYGVPEKEQARLFPNEKNAPNEKSASSKLS